MVQFKKLKLIGFKSFVDSTELEIGKGLTGVVGPNGCGKSNLVESLRWVMGETSAKRMRGQGMEDVIFNGTKDRPQRNFAEVHLHLDNRDRTAPAEINDSDDLEIIRRIERDMGSNYKVNGKNVRAKDIQLLFADSSIGADSPALVSQGRVADLINAKPTKRRLILEEAAGISGLHARKHEAELKMRAAEKNLLRLEDVMGSMEAQLSNLKKQARQAARYNNLSGHIEKNEALYLYIQYKKASDEYDLALETFKNAEKIVRENTFIVSELTTKLTNINATTPDLREAEANIAAILQHAKIKFSNLEAEEKKLQEDIQNTQNTIIQINTDIENEGKMSVESETEINKLRSELEILELADQSFNTDKSDAEKSKNDVSNLIIKLEEELNSLTEDLLQKETNKKFYIKEISYLEDNLKGLDHKLNQLKIEHAELNKNNSEQELIHQLNSNIQAKSEKLSEVKTSLEKASLDKTIIEEEYNQKQLSLNGYRSEFNELKSEANALENIINSSKDSNVIGDPILDKISVDKGYEKALVVALGSDLQAGISNNGQKFWEYLSSPVDAELPEDIKSISDYVDAPKELSRALSQIGIIEDANQAIELQGKLKTGQILVTKNGEAFRWDGFTILGELSDNSAILLSQKNRLKELKLELVEAQKSVADSELKFNALTEQRLNIQAQEKELNNNLYSLNSEIDADKRSKEKLEKASLEITNKINSIQHNIKTVEDNKIKDQTKLKDEQASLLEFGDNLELRASIDILKLELQNKRSILSEEQNKLNQIVISYNNRVSRIKEIQNNIASWVSRSERSSTRLSDLNERLKQASSGLDKLNSRPDNITSEKEILLNKINEFDIKRNKASDDLRETENNAREIQSELKAKETILNNAREDRALAQANVSNAKNIINNIDERIDEKFACNFNQLLPKFEMDPETTEIPAQEIVKSKLDKLVHERNNMGPVNLRADVESRELLEELTHMTKEKDDLMAAIGKLRQAISKLNKEARARLLGAFDKVNESFQKLFVRLFGGGTAHLELTDADDPLNAGLEIYAQPPGKKMQILSLFSGGEQTLTSISLIFAMFLTNPAPICVLDEIDAPLDDSNVDRVCSLLEDIVKETGTRFLVITHHRMTMARMDRLYGVTMSERGVSQLVSVDLRQQDLLSVA